MSEQEESNNKGIVDALSDLANRLNEIDGKSKENLFELAIANYPKRNGANPITRAKGKWNANIRERGISEQAMLDGVMRYKKWCIATGRINTEFVMQAVTFFGPDRHFELPWDLPAEPAAKKTRLARAVDAIKEAKNESVRDGGKRTAKDVRPQRGVLPGPGGTSGDNEADD